MVKVDVVARKLASATGRLTSAEELVARAGSRQGFLTNAELRDLATFYLLLAIQDCIDLGAHWVADNEWSPPDEIGAAFDVLADHGAIDRELAEGMRGAVGLRHRIAHGYTTVDHPRLFDEFETGVSILRRFLRRIADEAGL